MAKAASTPSLQSTFADSYRIIRALGDESGGTLFQAEQTSTDRPCALRILDAELVASPDGKKRFDELRVLRNRVRTDHVVDVLAAGIDKATGSPWFALEWLEGKTLDAHASEPLDDGDSLDLLAQVARALGAVHRAGLAVADLRPERVMVSESQDSDSPFQVTLLDFWTHAWRAEADEADDDERVFWRAPEQLQDGAKVGPAADVWAFGLLAFRLITGQVFWRAAEAEEGGDPRKEITRDAIPKASVRAEEMGIEPGLSPAFDKWFARCVARAPADRFESIGAAFDALVPVLETEEEDEEEAGEEPEPEPVKAPPAAEKPRRGGGKAKAPPPPAGLAASLPPWMRNSDFAIPAALVAAILVAFGLRASMGSRAPAAATPGAPTAAAPAAAAPAAETPRTLTESGAQAIEAALGASDRGSPVWIAVAAVDPAAEAMGRQLNAIFERAGWQTHPLQHPQMRARPGVFIFAESESPPPYLETVQRALGAGGLRPSTASGYRAYLAERRLQQPDYQGFDFEPGQTYVIVLGRGE